MYKEIEVEFKKKSTKFKDKLLFCMSATITIAIAITVIFVLPTLLNYSNWISMIICAGLALVYFGSCYMYICIKVRKVKEIKWYEFFNYIKIWNIYIINARKQDKDKLTEIIESKGINTRIEIQEAIRHYQNLLPRKVISGGYLISIFALVISVLAFMIADENKNDDPKQLFILLVILFVVIAAYYFMFKAINENVLKYLGKYALYERLETALSEIYVNYPAVKKKPIKTNPDEQKEL